MNPLGYSILADENIHPEVVTYLRREGFDILTEVQFPFLVVVERVEQTIRVRVRQR